MKQIFYVQITIETDTGSGKRLTENEVGVIAKSLKNSAKDKGVVAVTIADILDETERRGYGKS